MSFRIVIRAFTLRRDLAHSYILSKILETMGHQTFITCTRNHHFVLKYWKPHATIINTIGKINVTRELCPETKIILWPGEGARPPFMSDAEWLLTRNPQGTAEKVDLYILWGEYTRRAFLERFPKDIDSKIVITGHPKLDLVKYMPPVERDMKSIGFLMKFAGINFYNKKPTITPLIQNPQNGERIIKMQIDQFLLMLEIIEKIIAEGKFKVSIRPHPLEAPEGYFELVNKYPGKIQIDNSIDLSEWASKQRMILTPISSSFIDLTQLKIPVISIDHALLKKHPIISEISSKCVVTSMNGACYKPQDINEIMKMIHEELAPLNESAEMDHYNKDVYDWPFEKSAIKRAAEAVDKLLKNSPEIKNISSGIPKTALELYDWVEFYKAKYFSGDNHENFNYKNGYHHIPAHYKQIFKNIMAENKICNN